MGLDIPQQHTCEKQEKCCPNAQQGRIYRVPREMLSQIDWDNPQFSYRFKLEYAVRTKIERLIGRMKCRFRAHINVGGGSKNSYYFHPFTPENDKTSVI